MIVPFTFLRYNYIAYIAIQTVRKRVKPLYFEYGEPALSYLRQKDKRLDEIIDRIGQIHRTVDPDLFSSVMYHIIGQQIPTKAQAAKEHAT